MIVQHSRGTYEVILATADAAFHADRPGLFVVTDQNVHTHWSHLIPSTIPTLVLPAGEQTKSLIWLERVSSWLAAQGADRSSRVIAFGGGVIGDLVGFAAATYMRGVQYTQIPTTLLAQVDSSIGGKVAVDLPEGKNLVGAFYPPEIVVVDTGLLATLSARQFRNGMAEVCKYGFIMDVQLAERLSTATPEPHETSEIVNLCLTHKAKVVQEDEFETSGYRAILNFGHTIGHAIEQASGYKLLHGEAISLGMVLEAQLGENLGVTGSGTAKTVVEVLKRQGLPVGTNAPFEHSVLLEIMRRDKKAKGGRLSFSLLTQIGGCKLVEGVEESEVLRVLQE